MRNEKIYYTCDRCDEEITEEGVQISRFHPTVGIISDEDGGRDMHLCPPCAKELQTWIDRVETKTEERILTENKNRAKRDDGKIKSLLDAGWSIAKIADEFGVSYATMWRWTHLTA